MMLFATGTLTAVLAACLVQSSDARLRLKQIGQYVGSGSESAAYDRCKKQALVTSGDTGEYLVLNMTDPTNLSLITSSATTGSPNAIAVAYTSTARIFAVGSSDESLGVGKLYVEYTTQSASSAFLEDVNYGPDRVTITTTSGIQVVAAIQGEVDDNDVDHPGSIAVFDLSSTKYVGFESLDGKEADLQKKDIFFSPGVNASLDFEPESVSVRGKYAYATLQENNAIARVDLTNLAAKPVIYPLGLKDHGLPRNALDASDSDGGYNMRTYKNLFGAYQPGSIESFNYNGSTYLVTANEGDGREEVAVADIVLSKTAFPNAATLQTDALLGRLEVMPCDGCTEYDRLIAFGGRSFSIWKEGIRGLTLAFDSGNALERITHTILGDNFNSDGNGGGDSRSPKKGPEPEALAIGIINGYRYAFIGLERVGGVMVFDITVPERSLFITYFNNRDFTIPVEDCTTCDIAPETIVFIPAVNSPNGKNLLLVTNEVSKTTSVYQIQIVNQKAGPLRNPLKLSCPKLFF